MEITEEALAANKVRLGEWLTSRREKMGRTLRVAADRGGCSDSWLSQLETGSADITKVKLSSLPRLARAYSISIIQLVETMLKAAGVTDEQLNSTND